MDVSPNEIVKNIIPITPDVKWNVHCVLQTTTNIILLTLNGDVQLNFSSFFPSIFFLFCCCPLFLSCSLCFGGKCKKKSFNDFQIFFPWSFFRSTLLFMQELLLRRALGVREVNILFLLLLLLFLFRENYLIGYKALLNILTADFCTALWLLFLSSSLTLHFK